jgi:hypothetical protein
MQVSKKEDQSNKWRILYLFVIDFYLMRFTKKCKKLVKWKPGFYGNRASFFLGKNKIKGD